MNSSNNKFNNTSKDGNRPVISLRRPGVLLKHVAKKRSSEVLDSTGSPLSQIHCTNKQHNCTPDNQSQVTRPQESHPRMTLNDLYDNITMKVPEKKQSETNSRSTNANPMLTNSIGETKTGEVEATYFNQDENLLSRSVTIKIDDNSDTETETDSYFVAFGSPKPPGNLKAAQIEIEELKEVIKKNNADIEKKDAELMKMNEELKQYKDLLEKNTDLHTRNLEELGRRLKESERNCDEAMRRLGYFVVNFPEKHLTIGSQCQHDYNINF